MIDHLTLRQYVYRLYLKFIKAYIKGGALLPTKDEEDSIKAFCVLTHAALEEYFESVTESIILKSYKLYKSKAIIKKPLLDAASVDKANKIISQLFKTLLLATAYSIYHKNKSEVLHDHRSKLERVTDLYKTGESLTLHELSELTKKTDSYTKELLKEGVRFSQTQVSENHGASLKYILKLLIPAGIDVPETPLINSLQKLATYRGAYAHSRGNLEQILSAADATKYAYDCLKLCSIINNSMSEYSDYLEENALVA